jgi:hypothetical protein
VTPDFLAILSQNGIPKHELHLKQGCICSLMRNMSVQKGLVKNTRLIIQELHHHYVEVRLINNRTGQLGDAQLIVLCKVRPILCIPPTIVPTIPS